MSEQELYKQVHNQILDYADKGIISRSAAWGYAVQQELAKHKRELVQSGAEGGSDFMYAVATAVIIGEFAKRAFNDYFSDEVSIDLDLLDMDFKQIRGFIAKDIETDRLALLERENAVGLQDMWVVICEWKQHIHQSLMDICKEQGKGDPIAYIFTPLLSVFEYKDEETEEMITRSQSTSQEISAYSYVSEGFRY